MDLGLQDKVVFISGASGGIGRALAQCFAAEGARVALHGHRQWEKLTEWLSQQAWSDRAMTVRADVTVAREMDSALRSVEKRWGRVDVCVANAGICGPSEVPLVDIDEERVREVVDVNLLGAVWTARAFLKALVRSGPRQDGEGAVLLFTGSTAGRFGERGHADYASSKAALVGLMMTLKNEIVDIDPYARVNLVEPGWTMTEMVREHLSSPEKLTGVVQTMPLRQLARAQDIARTVVFLASPLAARHVSGQVVTVAGGMEGRVLWQTDQVDAAEVLRRLDEGG